MNSLKHQLDFQIASLLICFLTVKKNFANVQTGQRSYSQIRLPSTACHP